MKPVPEYWTEFTALAPIALSAACNKLLASCAAAGATIEDKIISSIPVLVLMPSSLGRNGSERLPNFNHRQASKSVSLSLGSAWCLLGPQQE
jgi:hypothetical protein